MKDFATSEVQDLSAAENADRVETGLTTELLILPDGQILVHNLTQPFAELLTRLNPDCESIASRTADCGSRLHP